MLRKMILKALSQLPKLKLTGKLPLALTLIVKLMELTINL